MRSSSRPLVRRQSQMSDNFTQNPVNAAAAFACIADGMRLALSKECRAYVIIPVLINILLLTLGGYTAFVLVKQVIMSLADYLPEFLLFLLYLLSILAALLIIFLCCYFFSTVASIIASPFYGLLADQAEKALNGTASEDSGIMGVIKDIPRCLKREFQKQCFFLPRAVLCLIVSCIPVVNLISPVPWFMLGSWMGCLQYVDYAYDNHKIPFKIMRNDLKTAVLPTYLMGAVIALCMAVPVLNIIVPPCAVCAGTKYYLELRKAAGSNLQATE